MLHSLGYRARCGFADESSKQCIIREGNGCFYGILTYASLISSLLLNRYFWQKQIHIFMRPFNIHVPMCANFSWAFFLFYPWGADMLVINRRTRRVDWLGNSKSELIYFSVGRWATRVGK